MIGTGNAAPPGWYPDPWEPQAQRYWDGAAWTPHVVPPIAPPVVPPPPPVAASAQPGTPGGDQTTTWPVTPVAIPARPVDPANNATTWSTGASGTPTASWSTGPSGAAAQSQTPAGPVPGWSTGASGVPATGRAGTGLSPTAMRFVVIAIAAVVVLGGLGLALAGAPRGQGGGNGGGGGSDAPKVNAGGADDQIRANTEALARAVEQYAGTYGNGPTWDEVSPSGGVGQFLSPWPANPITGAPMQPTSGGSPGDYKYQTAIRMPGGEYSGYVTGYLSDGTAYSVEYKY